MVLVGSNISGLVSLVFLKELANEKSPQESIAYQQAEFREGIPGECKNVIKAQKMY